MYENLSKWIEALEKEGELLRIPEYVDPILEIAVRTELEYEKENGGKALLFENTGTRYPVITNMFGSVKRMHSALGIKSFEELAQKITEFADTVLRDKGGFFNRLNFRMSVSKAMKWYPVIKPGNAPCQDVVQYACDLSKLPILKFREKDSGKLMNMGIVNSMDNSSGIRNAVVCQMHPIGDDTFAIHWDKRCSIARNLDKCESYRMPVAVSLGGDPALYYAGYAPIPDEIDEYLFAGFLRDKPVELVQCLTQDVQVPADCDFVLEGYIQKRESAAPEASFADLSGYYSAPASFPIFHVTCLTHRKQAVYTATVNCSPEGEKRFITLFDEELFNAAFRIIIAPELEEIHFPNWGLKNNIALVKIRNSYNGQAYKVADALWGTNLMMLCKIIIVLGKDIDLHDTDAVNAAIASNYDAASDTLITKGPLDMFDHSVQGFAGLGGKSGGKICIDATTPKNVRGHEKGIEFIHEGESSSAAIAVTLDEGSDASTVEEKLLELGINCDPATALISGGQLRLDARKHFKEEKA
ncbi:MAG: UbiD family decarboxylase [Bacteroidales bacterium]|jgi:4-hydroxy-3-polyprenylbenzoate decarboxylase|nr:UbiD family decarboxylase [Bacteroidales bacterium]MCI2121796.1 UbiD family decarboxylase [Bacteroidales bacterium]MCI2146027.1 UbiD family decarboxylase [Bacteroidales bacterium]